MGIKKSRIDLKPKEEKIMVGDDESTEVRTPWFHASGERCWLLEDERKTGFEENPCPTQIKATMKAFEVYLRKIESAMKKSGRADSKAEINAAVKAIKELLTNPFVYSISYNKNDSEHYWMHRPIIEALFFEHNAKFLNFIELVIQLDNAKLYKAVFSAMDNTDVPRDALFKWDQTMSDCVAAEIESMRNYGRKLKGELLKDVKPKVKQVISKGKHKANFAIPLEDQLDEATDTPEIKRGKLAKQVALKLSKQLNSSPAFIDQNSHIDDKFMVLRFKLKMLNTMHAHDSDFAGHRGFKEFAANICFILVGFLPNIIQLLYTRGKKFYLFHCNTTTQTKVDNVQSALNLKTKQKIKLRS